jgi:urease accessory protein
VTVITSVVGSAAELAETMGRDLLVLTSEERSSPHFVRTTGQGRTVRVSLPRGTEINDGDVLAIDGGVAIVVSAAPEALLSISPHGAPIDWAAVGYQLGNLHRPVRFLDAGMLTPVDPMVEDLLTRMKVPFQRVQAPFVGRRYGSMSGHHHEHAPAAHDEHDRDDHDHDHRHHHGHSHDPGPGRHRHS